MPSSRSSTNSRGIGTPDAIDISSTTLMKRRSCGSDVVGSTGTAPTDSATAAPPARSVTIFDTVPPTMISTVTTGRDDDPGDRAAGRRAASRR